MSETALDKFPPKESAPAGWDDGSPVAIWWCRQPSYQYPEQRKVGPAVFATEDVSLVPDSYGRFGGIRIAAYLPARRSKYRFGSIRKKNKLFRLFRKLYDALKEAMYEP